MLMARVNRPLLPSAVHELTSADYRFPAMGGVPNAGMDESEALAGLDGKGCGVVAGVTVERQADQMIRMAEARRVNFDDIDRTDPDAVRAAVMTSWRRPPRPGTHI
jgi:hypothetical protein